MAPFGFVYVPKKCYGKVCCWLAMTLHTHTHTHKHTQTCTPNLCTYAGNGATLLLRPPLFCLAVGGRIDLPFPLQGSTRNATRAHTHAHAHTLFYMCSAPRHRRHHHPPLLTTTVTAVETVKPCTWLHGAGARRVHCANYTSPFMAAEFTVARTATDITMMQFITSGFRGGG